MQRLVRALVVATAAAVVTVVSTTPTSAGPVGKGMLSGKDVGLSVVSKPHSSTVIAYALVDPATCAAQNDEEHDARVVSFGSKAGSAGSALNQVVYDFASKGDAAAFFTDLRSSSQAQVDCGSTEKATNLAMVKAPKGVGDARFTVTSKELIGGKSRAVRSVSILVGDTVTELIFLDWSGSPSPTKVAKAAAARLS